MGIWAWIIVIILVIGILIYALSAIYWIIATIAYIFFAVFDVIFSAGLQPNMPAAMWIIWGGVIGGILGFWTMAPMYGMRTWRSALVVVIISVLILGSAAFQLSKG